MEGDVVEPAAASSATLRVDVERVDVLGVCGDAAQAAPLERPDLDRQPRSQLSEQTLEREALALLHLPAISAHGREREERVHGGQPRGCYPVSARSSVAY